MCPYSWHSLILPGRVCLGYRKSLRESLSTVIKANGKLQQLGSGRISNGPYPSGMKVSVTILGKEQWTAEFFLRAKRLWNGLLKTITNIIKDHVTSCRNEIKFVIV